MKGGVRCTYFGIDAGAVGGIFAVEISFGGDGVSYVVKLLVHLLHAQLSALTIQLQYHQRTMQQYKQKVIRVIVYRYRYFPTSILRVHETVSDEVAQMINTVQAKSEHVNEEGDEEKEEIFVVARAEAIVDEDAVVVELVDATIAVITMTGALRS